ncbi:MAG TPA: extracellular solute-binding protein [Limnochordia bacterium]|nr:extracellular solute-binding protein [Limnochordia bacterium]
MRSRACLAAACAALLLAAPAGAAQKRVIHVGLAIRELQPYYEGTLKPTFEAQHPDIDVEFEYTGWAVDKYLAAYAAGNPPDVAQIGNGIGPYLQLISPLDDDVKGWADLKDFPKPVLDGFTVGGHLWALPWTYGTRVLQYRKDWFAESGLDPNKPPASWDELAQMATKTARYDKDNRLTRQGFATSAHYIDFSTFLFQAGGRFMSPDLKQATYADERGLEAVRYVQSLFKEYRVTDPDRKLKGLHDGGAAMEYDQPDFAPGASSAFTSDAIGVALPAAALKTQIILPEGLIISNKSAHPEAAWAWVHFMLSMDQILTKGRALYSFGGIPPRLSAAQYSPWKDDPRWQVVFQSLATARTPPQASPDWDSMRSKFLQPALEKIFYEGASPATLVENMAAANAWLAERTK